MTTFTLSAPIGTKVSFTYYVEHKGSFNIVCLNIAYNDQHKVQLQVESCNSNTIYVKSYKSKPGQFKLEIHRNLSKACKKGRCFKCSTKKTRGKWRWINDNTLAYYLFKHNSLFNY